MKFEEQTWKDIHELNKNSTIVFIPVGTIEQHGLHLPLGTDTFIIYEIANLFRKTRNDILLLPPIWYGYSYPIEKKFVGHITIYPDVLAELLERIIILLKSYSFKRFILIFDHYPNTVPIQSAVQKISKKEDIQKIIIVNFWELIRDGLSLFDHTGFHSESVETSILYYLRKELVKVDRIVDEFPTTQIGYDLFPRKGDLVSRSGVIGDPSHFSEEKAKIAVNLAIQNLTNIVGELQLY